VVLVPLVLVTMLSLVSRSGAARDPGAAAVVRAVALDDTGRLQLLNFLQEADVVFVGSVSAAGEDPAAWGGSFIGLKTVDFAVARSEDVLKGSIGPGHVSVRYPVVVEAAERGTAVRGAGLENGNRVIVAAWDTGDKLVALEDLAHVIAYPEGSVDELRDLLAN
jgi:hypothetical protein